MAEARELTRTRVVYQNIKDLFAAHTIRNTGGLLFLLLAIFLLWPIFMVLLKSINGPEGITLQYYKEFVTKDYYYRSFFNTLLLGLIVTPLCIGAGFCIAYMTTRGPVFLRRSLRLIALLPLMAPPFIFALSLIILLGHNGIITKALNLSWSIYGFTGCVISQTLWLIPLAYMMIENTLSTLNPNLEDSAANLGASEGKILRSIIIPLLTPGFLKAALIIFVMTVSAFGALAILCGRTPFLAPDVYLLITGEGDFNRASVLSMFLILPCAVIFIIQNYLIRGKRYTTIVGKPVAAEPKHLGPVILIPMLAVSFIACGFILLTFGVVGIAAFIKLMGIDNTFTLIYILDARSNVALTNSIKISLLSGLLGAMLGVLLAYVIIRGKFKGLAALEGLGLAGFTLPGTVMGIGYILAFNKPPLILTGTLAILVLNCAFRQLGVGMEAGIIKLKQLSIEIEEASLNLGANVVTTFRRIVLPIIFPACMYGFMYVFILSMIGLSAVVFLVTPGYELASVYIFDAAIWGELGIACATTIKLVIVVGICLAIIQGLSKWTGLSAAARRGV